ncbi:hypothetical protein Nepgr_032232 [Nepenthes gracilis]|uniref:Uncharacterized protein n=1 Tax=Nepenthes gracilis TaxID=150966 RepID=A0AAD3Y7Q6_NEPGR|nr:hypothetical protein Nepgr_032232 [Nepenthes gracilis]
MTVEVEIVYHSKLARRSSALLSNQKNATFTQPLPQVPGVDRPARLGAIPRYLPPEDALDGRGCCSSLASSKLISHNF